MNPPTKQQEHGWSRHELRDISELENAVELDIWRQQFERVEDELVVELCRALLTFRAVQTIEVQS